jgi:hypothetical protein
MATSSTSVPVLTGRTAVLVQRTITSVVFVIAGLAFAFGFGNGWLLGEQLGVPGWIAPLVAPAVDLSVAGLLTSIHVLRAHGLGGRLVGPRLLLVFCGFITCALNTVRPILAGEVGRACFDAIAPLLLIGWSEVGPRLLGLLHGTAVRGNSLVLDGPTDEDEVERAQDGSPALSPSLLRRARQLDAQQRKETGKRITRDKLRAGLRVSNEVAGLVLREIQAPVTAGVATPKFRQLFILPHYCA